MHSIIRVKYRIFYLPGEIVAKFLSYINDDVTIIIAVVKINSFYNVQR